MNNSFYMAALVVALSSCIGQKPGYELSGKVNNTELNGKYVYLYTYGMDSQVPMDSALVENGNFTLKGSMEGNALSVLRFSPDVVKPTRAASGLNAPFTALFLLENGKLTVVLDSVSTVTGTPENDSLKDLQAKIKDFNDKIDAIELGSNPDYADNPGAEKEADALNDNLVSIVNDYITANLNKKTAAILLSDFRYDISEEQQIAILEKADSVFKSVPGIDKMIEHMEVLKNVAVGKTFIDFEMNDLEGRSHKLSDYVGKGKVVLLDFWASWCPPCRKEMPSLVKLYKEFKGKGFEIVGISLDSKSEAWAKGIKDLSITWPQLSDLKGWKNEGAALYGVNSIPHILLIDKDGTIIARNLSGDKLIQKVKEALK